jgi:hypothetical protein
MKLIGSSFAVDLRHREKSLEAEMLGESNGESSFGGVGERAVLL